MRASSAKGYMRGEEEGARHKMPPGTVGNLPSQVALGCDNDTDTDIRPDRYPGCYPINRISVRNVWLENGC